MRPTDACFHFEAAVLAHCAAKVLKVGCYLNWVRVWSECDGFWSTKLLLTEYPDDNTAMVMVVFFVLIVRPNY